jgi:hypothetical protein
MQQKMTIDRPMQQKISDGDNVEGNGHFARIVTDTKLSWKQKQNE